MNYDLTREMIKRHEGLRLSPYFCPAGHKTIGFGWNMEAHQLPDDIASCLRMTGKITEVMAERLLTIAIDATVRNCEAIFPLFASFSDKRQAALVDFVYNVGSGTALTFKKMIAAIREGDWMKAADEMRDSRWFKQVGDRSKEIVEMVRNG